LSYPANEAKKVDKIEHFYASSDCDKILKIADNLGYKKIKRPPELGLPTANHIDAIIHALDFMKSTDGISPDILIVLLANSATLKSEWIEQGINGIVKDSSISSIVPVYQEQNFHPYRAKRINENGSLDTFFDFTDIEVASNRQQLDPCYFLCHNFWVLNMKNSRDWNDGQKPWVHLGNNIKPIIVDGCFDVHTLDDLIETEKWLKSYHSLS